MDFKTLIGYDEVLNIISKITVNPRAKSISVYDSVGRIAFNDVKSPGQFPPFDRSAVDGFALRSEETISASRSNPIRLRLQGTVSGNTVPDFKITREECARVFTGADIPDGCDSVVMQEDAEVLADEVSIFKQVRKYQNIMRTGEDLRKEDIIIHAGEKILPWHLAAMIECGFHNTRVYDEEIGILSTGDELVSGKLQNSTAPMLASIISDLGLHATFHGNVIDDETAILNKMNTMDENIIIVTGGSGPSSLDMMHSVLSNSGKLLFHGVRIKPGRTTGIGIFRDRPVFIVSGLPVATLIAFDYIILPALRSWLQLTQKVERTIEATLTRSVFNNDGVKMFVRVKISRRDDEYFAEPLRTTGSGIISSIINADGYLIVPEELEGYREGDSVNVTLVGDRI